MPQPSLNPRDPQRLTRQVSASEQYHAKARVVMICVEKRKAEASGPTINPSMLKKDKTNEWHFR